MAAANGVIKELQPEYYTCRDVALLIGCSESHARKIIRQARAELISKGVIRDWYTPGKVPKMQFRKMIGLKE